MLDQKTLRELLDYNPDTGVFIRKTRTANAINVGDVAGYVNACGYVIVSVQNKPRLAHRLAWLYMYGSWPTKNLDHADGNRENNAISNLRECNQSQNVANTRLGRRNSSGFKGVSCIPGRKSPWRARITIDYKERTIGYYKTQEDAYAAYCKAAAEAFGEFHRPK